MSKRPTISFVERVLRPRPWLVVCVWLSLVLAATVSLLLVGAAPPTLYEGF